MQDNDWHFVDVVWLLLFVFVYWLFFKGYLRWKALQVMERHHNLISQTQDCFLRPNKILPTIGGQTAPLPALCTSITSDCVETDSFSFSVPNTFSNQLGEEEFKELQEYCYLTALKDHFDVVELLQIVELANWQKRRKANEILKEVAKRLKHILKNTNQAQSALLMTDQSYFV